VNPFIVLSIIGLWLIYSLLIKLTKKRKYDYSIVVAFVFLVGMGYFYVYEGFDGEIYTYFSYSSAAVFALWMIIDNVTLLFRKNVSEFDFRSLEEKIEYVSHASELLRYRFISTIELLNDGISFNDGGQIFGTDRYIEIIGLKNNEFTVQEFENLLIKEDLVQYRITIDKCSKKYPTYRIKYRVKNNGEIKWVQEHGKMIFIDKKQSFISIVKPLEIKHYPETDIDVLNNLENDKKLLDEMQSLQRKKIPFHLVVIQLTNVPKINEKYGRDFGDLMMGEYLSKMRFKFIKDNKSLFRISGIKFGLIIKEKNKFAIMDRALVGSGELFTLQMKFGGVEQTIYPNLGIAESPYEGKNAEQVLKEAEHALSLTLRSDYGKSFAYYDSK
jgi:GGDEF domain-containing protein